MRQILSFTIFVFLLSVQSARCVVDRGSEILEISPEIWTPHTCWAKPYAKGTVKALVIGPRYGMREIIELWQRMDLSYEVIMADSYKNWGDPRVKNLEEESILELFRKKLKNDYDVIILGNIEWGIIPQDILLEILKKVSKGTGFVYCQFTEGQNFGLFETLLSPVEPPSFLQQLFIPSKATYKTFTLKNGRVFIFKGSGGPGLYHFLISNVPNRSDYEYEMSTLIKGILWAAKKEPDISIKIEQDKSGIIIATLSDSQACQRLRLILRDNNYCEVYTAIQEITSGKTKYTFKLPFLMGGNYYATISCDTNKGVINWTTVPLEIPTLYSPITIIPDKEFYRPGDVASFNISFNPFKEKIILLAELVDNYERIIFKIQKEVIPGTSQVSLSFTLPHKSTILNTFKVTLLTFERKPLITGSCYIYIPPRGHNGFALLSWVSAGGDTYQSQLLGKTLCEMGFDSAMWTSSRTGLRPMPYAIVVRGDSQDGVRIPCLTDPKYIEESKNKVQKVAKSLRREGPIGYSLGDEPCLTVSGVDVCFSDTCKKDFREYLKVKYGTLDKLNEEWETHYENWESVNPATRADAEKKGNLAPYIDHRLHMDSVMTRFFHLLKNVIVSEDDAARAGPEGIWATNETLGIDWYGLCKNVTMILPYSVGTSNLGREAVCSFADRSMLTGTWYGSYENMISDTYLLTREPWLQLFHNATSIGWYAPYRYSHLSGNGLVGILPDFRPSSPMRASLNEIKRIKDGIDAVILNSLRDDNGIAILYSRASMYTLGRSSFDELAPLLEDLNYQYRVISTEELESGILEKNKIKMLVLPSSIALSDVEISAIKSFVSRGGIVLADLMPGIFDDHGKRRKDFELTKVFGVRANYPFKHETVRLFSEKLKMEIVLPGVLYDPSLELVEAFAEGEINNTTPAIIINHFGKGKAILMNFSTDNYQERITQDWAEAIRLLFDSLFLRYGPEPVAKTMDENGKRVYGYEVVQYFCDNDAYIGVFKRRFALDEKPKKINILWKKPRVVYDITNHQYFGETDKVTTIIPLGPPIIFALTSKPFPKPALQVSKNEITAGESFNYTIILPLNDTRTRFFRVKMISPSGKVVPYFTSTVVIKTTTTETINTAFNEEKGVWKLTLTDIVTGENITQNLQIK